jgi:hypothetical protein
MGTSKKGRGSPPDTQDIIELYATVRKDLGLVARHTVRDRPDGKLVIRAEIFREENGVRLGITAYEEGSDYWGPQVREAMWRTLVKAYWAASELAHARPMYKGLGKST